MSNIANTTIYIDGMEGNIAALKEYLDSCNLYDYCRERRSFSERLGVPPSAGDGEEGWATLAPCGLQLENPKSLRIQLESGGDECVWPIYALAYEFNCMPCFFCEEPDDRYFASDDVKHVHFKETYYLSVEIAKSEEEAFRKVLRNPDEDFDDYPWLEIDDVDEYVREKFTFGTYKILKNYLKKHCPESSVMFEKMEYSDKYAHMRAPGKAMCRLKFLAKQHNVRLPDLYELRDRIWSMNRKELREILLQLFDASTKGELQACLLCLGLE